MKTKQELITELKNGKTINEVCHENNISLQQLMKITRTHPKPTKPKYPKYISRSGKRYRIIRQQGRESKFYGSFTTLSEAQKVLRQLIKHDWNLEPCEYMGLMYIIRDRNGWKIQKLINGEMKHIKYFKNRNDAIQVRDALVKLDWDLDYLPLILRKIGVKPNGN